MSIIAFRGYDLCRDRMRPGCAGFSNAEARARSKGGRLEAGSNMDKRLLKRHQRQVLRAKERVRVSEPDLRTPEQVIAAREASRRVAGQHDVPRAPYSAPSSTPKADTEA